VSARPAVAALSANSTPITSFVKKRLWVTAAALAIVALVGTMSRALWLPWPAAWLHVSDSIKPADVIVVLSGNSLWRAKGAARLYREHYAPRIIVSGGGTDEYFELLTGERVDEAELIGRVLARFGVPRDALVFINGMTSTHDEALAFKAYIGAHPIRTAILVTSHLHSRRARWTFRRALGGTAVEVLAVEADQPDVRVRDWWQHPDAALDVLNEYLKFGYYLFHY
jgi:uncharacterized SAM-binding protein YcdF (DUF218 family)